MFAHISQPSSAVKTATHPFDIIYQAAKEKDAEKITFALQHVCIDVQKTGGYGVPISQLAAEKDIDSVNFLREKFSASLLWMAYGYALGGHTTEAGNLLKLATSPAERAAILKNITHGAKQAGRELVQSIALKGLALEDKEESRTMLARELKESNAATTYDIVKLIPRAKKINQVMTAQKLNYDQGLAWTQPEVQIWFLQCAVLVGNGKNKISAEIFLLISSFLSPMSGAEAALCSNRVYAHTFEARFFSNLSKHNRLLSVGEWPYFDVTQNDKQSKTNLNNQSLFKSSSLSDGSSSSSSKPSSEKKKDKCTIM